MSMMSNEPNGSDMKLGLMQKAASYRAQAREFPDRAGELLAWAKRFEQMAIWMQPEEGMSLPMTRPLPHARMLDPRTWAENPDWQAQDDHQSNRPVGRDDGHATGRGGKGRKSTRKGRRFFIL